MTTHAMEIEHERSGATARIEGEIRRRTESSIAYFTEHPDEIDERLAELDEEWDLERVLQANAAGLTLFSAAMGLLSGRKWFLVTGAVGALMLRYVNRRQCPPVGLLRRLGYRTLEEIDHERYALMAIRGDFDELAQEQEGGRESQRGKQQQQPQQQHKQNPQQPQKQNQPPQKQNQQPQQKQSSTQGKGEAARTEGGSSGSSGSSGRQQQQGT